MTKITEATLPRVSEYAQTKQYEEGATEGGRKLSFSEGHVGGQLKPASCAAAKFSSFSAKRALILCSDKHASSLETNVRIQPCTSYTCIHTEGGPL